MRILLLGDYSNYHQCLAGGLRQLGHDVTVVSNGTSWMNTKRDIDISRPYANKLGGLILLHKIKKMRPELSGYDIVQINNPCFVDLRPHRLKSLFDWLKKNNRSIFMTAMGSDSAYVKMCVQKDCQLRYNEWVVDGSPAPLQVYDRISLQNWLATELSEYCRYVYDNIDGAVSALYEYDLSLRQLLPEEKIAYGGIPIDTHAITPVLFDEIPEKIKFFLGRHRTRQVEKGTDRIEIQVRKVVEKYQDRCRLEIVENVPYSEYLKRLRNAHVVLDQLYSYTPATNALLAMAMGLNTLSGAEPEFYDFIGEKTLRPIINAIPDDEKLYQALEEVVLQPEMMIKRSVEGRTFVEKHNDVLVVAKRFVDFWAKRLNAM